MHDNVDTAALPSGRRLYHRLKSVCMAAAGRRSAVLTILRPLFFPPSLISVPGHTQPASMCTGCCGLTLLQRLHYVWRVRPAVAQRQQQRAGAASPAVVGVAVALVEAGLAHAGPGCGPADGVAARVGGGAGVGAVGVLAAGLAGKLARRDLAVLQACTAWYGERTAR